MKLDKVSEFMEQAGVPGRDLYDRSASGRTFSDGCHYRIEFSGVEGPRVLEALIAERHRRDIPIHRLVSFCQGGTLFDDAELKDFAQMAAEDKMEVIAIPGPRAAWDIGRQFLSPEGARCGMNLRGSDEIRKVIADMFRMYELGMRGFMLVDRGVLALVKKMQEQGNFPRDVTIKLSVWAGVSSPAGAMLAEQLGANSFNPVSDLTFPQMAAIRRVTSIPIDFYIWTFNSYGGENRIYDAPEAAKIYAPCYFKFEPAVSSSTTYSPFTSDAEHIALMQKKVKWAEWVIHHVMENEPGLKLSQQGAPDLFLPRLQ
ncbi:MAG: U32 family peptidase [Synergistaceae bacterium]|jgi:hypothetical protein|nr:U32 family peptidase [Synergistaceae bacterium]